MKKTTAAAAAGAVALTATGAVSALFMTMGAAQSPAAASSEPVVLTEYVDQDGNPVEAPGTTAFEMPEIVVVEGPAPDPIVTTEYADTYVASDASAASGEALASDGEEHDDDEDEIDPVTGEYVDDDEDEIDPVTGEYVDDEDEEDEEDEEEDDD